MGFNRDNTEMFCDDIKTCALNFFHFYSSKIFCLLYGQNFKILALFCDCTDWFVSDLVGNHIDSFSHKAVQL